jgi:hypothetical protein
VGARTHHYWHFYWPLTLMGVVMLAGRLAHNYVLLGYPEGVGELAIFALARAVYLPFQASLIFLPQMATVLVRGRQSLRACLRFMLTVCLLLSLPVVVMGWTPFGRTFLTWIYDVPPERIARIVLYMRFFTPLIMLWGFSQIFTGLLVQARRTRLVTGLRMLDVSLLVGFLALGVRLGWEPVLTIAVSILVPRVVSVIVGGLCVALLYHHRAPENDRALGQREILAFYFPMMVSALLFALTRPLIFAFLTALNPGGEPGLPDVDSMVAACSLAFTFNMLFHQCMNQFRHLFVTFGREDRSGVRRFMRRVTVAVTGIMLVVVLTPIAGWFLRGVQGASGITLEMAVQALHPLLIVPMAIALRNYYHGIAMVHRRTASMAIGSAMRNLSVLIAAAVLFRLGLYNHVAAAGMLGLAFIAEATTASILIRRWRIGEPGA